MVSSAVTTSFDFTAHTVLTVESKSQTFQSNPFISSWPQKCARTVSHCVHLGPTALKRSHLLNMLLLRPHSDFSADKIHKCQRWRCFRSSNDAKSCTSAGNRDSLNTYTSSQSAALVCCVMQVSADDGRKVNTNTTSLQTNCLLLLQPKLRHESTTKGRTLCVRQTWKLRTSRKRLLSVLTAYLIHTHTKEVDCSWMLGVVKVWEKPEQRGFV